MKTLVYILLITFFTASVFAEEEKGELDGKALECLHGKYGVTVTHWIFDGIHVSTPLVTRNYHYEFNKEIESNIPPQLTLFVGRHRMSVLSVILWIERL